MRFLSCMPLCVYPWQLAHSFDQQSHTVKFVLYQLTTPPFWGVWGGGGKNCVLEQSNQKPRGSLKLM